MFETGKNLIAALFMRKRVPIKNLLFVGMTDLAHIMFLCKFYIY